MTTPIIATFTNKGGTSGDIQHAAAKLTLGQQYNVVTAAVDSWCTIISLEGVDGYFNSCCFDVDWDQLEQLALEHCTHVYSDMDT